MNTGRCWSRTGVGARLLKGLALRRSASWVDTSARSNQKTTNSAARFAVLLQPRFRDSALQLPSQVHVDMVLHANQACPAMVAICPGTRASSNRAVHPRRGRSRRYSPSRYEGSIRYAIGRRVGQQVWGTNGNRAWVTCHGINCHVRGGFSEIRVMESLGQLMDPCCRDWTLSWGARGAPAASEDPVTTACAYSGNGQLQGEGGVSESKKCH